MCGIAGIIDCSGETPDRVSLERMCEALIHRGPDDVGLYLNGKVALGQRRLSIIDLSGGHQPMSNDAGDLWVTFNGEIYNYQDVRKSLIAAGHRFRTDSDTEVILHAYKAYGEQCLQHFRGMFAFALWDEKQQRLFLARDRLGKKPLFFFRNNRQFIFSSELHSLITHPQVDRSIHLPAIDQYLSFGYIPAPNTIYQNVQKLLPAHYLVLDVQPSMESTNCRIERYWQLDYSPKQNLLLHEAKEMLLEELTEAVRLRMIADVPIGALLSGGIDSGLIVALMSKLSSQPVKTFSIGFAEQEFNETRYARMVADRYRTDHHELIVRPQALDILPKLVKHYGEPYADSSAVPSYYVSQLTREHVKVALNGDGGDECFAGYERYLGMSLADRYGKLPKMLRHLIRSGLTHWVPDSWSRRNRFRQAKRFVQVADQPQEKRYCRWIGYFSEELKQQLYHPEFSSQLNDLDGSGWMDELFDVSRTTDNTQLDTVLYVDVQSYLPYDLLVKMDIASMANSLEMRSPFLDHKIVEFSAVLPDNLKLRGTTLKYILKQIGKDLLPREIVTRRKMGFGVPVGKWMREELRDLVMDTLLSPDSRVHSYFKERELNSFVQDHLENRRDYSSSLWALLCLELWHREFLR